jgi:hypothetical protein
VILSSILLGSRIKVGSTTRLRSAPGRSWEMMCERTAHYYQYLYSSSLIDALTISLLRLYNSCLLFGSVRLRLVMGGPAWKNKSISAIYPFDMNIGNRAPLSTIGRLRTGPGGTPVVMD